MSSSCVRPAYVRAHKNYEFYRFMSEGTYDGSVTKELKLCDMFPSYLVRRDFHWALLADRTKGQVTGQPNQNFGWEWSHRLT